MSTFSIRNQEFIKWARSYSGPKFHALFADLPYGLAFMGKDWDSPGGPAAYQAQAKQWGEAMLPLLYPGALVFLFGGTRTSHRLTCGMEDAGFEMWDVMMWIHSQGFPKAQDISKLIDKANGDQPGEVVGTSSAPNHSRYEGERYGETRQTTFGPVQDQPLRTAPGSLISAPWAGHKTCAFKPAWEPILCFRAPRGGMTYAELALAFGTGALNVDGGRIAAEKPIASHRMTEGGHGQTTGTFNGNYQSGDNGKYTQVLGRFPANLILDEESAKLLDAQSGVSKSRKDAGGQSKKGGDVYLHGMQSRNGNSHADEGGASRFFYVAKASKKERGEGNSHPCVKPLALCRHLAALLLPPASVVPRRILVPFTGSGSEMIGALQAGWDEVIGVEQEAQYCKIAAKRLAFHQRGSIAKLLDANEDQVAPNEGSTTEARAKRATTGRTVIPSVSVAQYPGRKCWFLRHAAKYFRAHPCQTIVEPFAGSGVVGVSLLHAGIIDRLVLVEKDERMVCLLKRLLDDSTLADRYATFSCTRVNVEKLLREEKSAFRYLVQSRCSNRAKFDGGLRTVIDERWCRDMVVRNIRRVYALRDRITVVEGDGSEVMRQYSDDPNVGCFADPPYSADASSKGHTVYRHHKLSHQKLFSILAGWRGPWLLTEDNSPMVRSLALCYRFSSKRVETNTSDNRRTTELVLWRR